jgi:conserved hypothetical protein, YceG family
MKFKSNKKKKRKSNVYRGAGGDSSRAAYGVDSYDSSSVRSGYSGGSRPREEGHKSSGKRGKSKRGGKGRAGLIVLIAFLVILIGGVVVAGIEITGNTAKAEGEIVIEVPSGAATSDVAKVLHDNKLIGSTMVFRAYSKVTKSDGTYQEGKHQVTGGMSYSELIETLQQTTYVEVETVTMTFPEGTTALKMAMMLEEEGFFSVDDFINSCNNDNFDISFYKDISHTDKFIVLEGFLFPDTYEFEVGSTAHDIIQQMLENFEEKVLTPERMALIESNKYTLEELIILASIVEKESLGQDSYSKVAAVFHNRLNSDAFPCLESCTSRDWVREGLGHRVGEWGYGGYFPYVLELYYGSYEAIPQNIRDGYDTMTHEGLIVGAICNPGLLAIDGAITPEPNWNYYFFCTDKDGKFYWAETAEEHARNAEEAGLS